MSASLPILRNDEPTLKERMTENAYESILPARYLSEGETQEDLFERVGQNVAVAEAVHTDEIVTITASEIKPDHPSRDELITEVFGEGDEQSFVVELTEENAKHVAYDPLVDRLTEIGCEETLAEMKMYAEKYVNLMEKLQFMPNSPTLMNAGDELQQLSACFVLSPDDDMKSIHDTARDAALTFQCLTEESTVIEQNKGIVSVSNVEEGDAILQSSEEGFQYKTVKETHEYDNSPTVTLDLNNGLEIRGTPNHELLVNGEWTRLDDVSESDKVHYSLGWLEQLESSSPVLETVSEGAQWNRKVSNEEIFGLYQNGLSDYKIAERLDVGKSTVQRRRANELELPPNNNTGRSSGHTIFDEQTVVEMYEDGMTDGQIADELDISKSTVQRFRNTNNMSPNGLPVKEVTQPQQLTTQLAELVGLWAGDGSYHIDGIRFHVSREETVQWLEETVQDIFHTSVSKTYSEGCYTVSIHSHEIRRFWKKNFDVKSDGSQEVTVPSIISKATPAEIKAYIRGYISADGTINRDSYPAIYSSSEECIEQIATLMMGLGIPVKKNCIRDSDENPYYSVCPTTDHGRELFRTEIGFLSDRKIQTVDNPRDTDYDGSNDWTVSVDNVEVSKNADVYDITVEENHHYVTDGIISHNSGGGMGYAFSNLRPYGDKVGSTDGIASGPITFMRTFDQLCETVAQGGARRGAQMTIMECWHPDVIEFIHAKDPDVSLAVSLRLNDADDPTHNSFADALEEARDVLKAEGFYDDNDSLPRYLRNAIEGHLSNFNMSVGITDEFMEAVKADEKFTFKNPRTEEPHVATEETLELWEQFGYGEYIEVGEVLRVPAREVWSDMIHGAHQNGEPGCVFIDRINDEHSFDPEEHPEYVIEATNPCVTGDTLVATADGRGGVPIGELIHEEDVQVYTRTDDGVGVALANNIRKTREDADLVEVTTDGEVSLECTEDHPIWTRNRGWVEAGNLKEGDSLHILYETDHNSGYNNLTWTDDEDRWNLEHRLVARDLLDMDISGYTIHHEDGDKKNNDSENLSLMDPSEHGAKHAPDISGEDNPIHQLKKNGEFEEYKEDNTFYDVEGENNPMYGKSHSEETKEKIADSEYEERSEKVSETIQKQYDEGKPVECKECGEEFKALSLHLKSHDMSVQNYREKYGDDVRLSASQPVENHKVVSVEPSGSEDVYDLEVPETHNFYAGDTDGEYINIHNCGEQPLMQAEACNLGHINLSTIVAENGKSWDQFVQSESAFYPDGAKSQEFVHDFLVQALDMDEFERRIRLGARFLDNVITMSNYPTDEIEQVVRDTRKTGLGLMGLAQMYVQIGVEYGSDAGNEIAREIMRLISQQSQRVSHELAEERGVFADWSKSKWANLDEYREWAEKHGGEWIDKSVSEIPMRNHKTSQIAPTGTTSMVSNTTGGCEPMYNVAYYKNVSGDVQGDEELVEVDELFVQTLQANEIDVDAVKAEAQELMENRQFDGPESLTTVPDSIAELFVTTGDLSAEEHLGVQCALQEYTDAAISKTVNAPFDATESDTSDAFELAYDDGAKGVTYYRQGSRNTQVLATEKQSADDDESDKETVEIPVETFERLADETDEIDVIESDAESELDTCLDCGAEQLVFREGCKECEVCGWSACEY